MCRHEKRSTSAQHSLFNEFGALDLSLAQNVIGIHLRETEHFECDLSDAAKPRGVFVSGFDPATGEFTDG